MHLVSDLLTKCSSSWLRGGNPGRRSPWIKAVPSGECPEDGKDGLRALERLVRSQIARCLAGVAHFFQALKSRLVGGFIV